MAAKIMSAEDAVDLIQDGMTVAVNAFVGLLIADELLYTLEQKYLKTQTPRDLTVTHADGAGLRDFPNYCNRFAHKGLIKKYIAGHWDSTRHIVKMAIKNQIEAYCIPQGQLSRLFRAIAAGMPGVISHVGLNTFVDPRLEGGKLNEISKEDFVRLIQVDGKDYLFYKTFPIDIALIRGTTADAKGNISMEKEGIHGDALAIAMAAHNSGGKVIVQVERFTESGTIHPKRVDIPGILVDAVVKRKQARFHQQVFANVEHDNYNPSISGELRVPLETLEESEVIGPDGRVYKDEPFVPFGGPEKIFCRRATFELEPDSIVNLGIGKPELVAKVASEEGIANLMTLTVEAGPVGGIPQKTQAFGSSLNPQAIIHQNQMFDFYDGGGLDICFLGIAEFDKEGNVNVSRVGSAIIGAGGFIDISQNSKKVVFLGTFSLEDLQIKIENGKVTIVREGSYLKIRDKVKQITFAAEYAKTKGQPVFYMTERCVFKLTEKGLMLIEIAPGIDAKKDILDKLDFKILVADDLKLMDPRIFEDKLMNIKSEVMARGK